jgi:hypothetical protein
VAARGCVPQISIYSEAAWVQLVHGWHSVGVTRFEPEWRRSAADYVYIVGYSVAARGGEPQAFMHSEVARVQLR